MTGALPACGRAQTMRPRRSRDAASHIPQPVQADVSHRAFGLPAPQLAILARPRPPEWAAIVQVAALLGKTCARQAIETAADVAPPVDSSSDEKDAL